MADSVPLEAGPPRYTVTRERARTPARAHDRVLAIFRGVENLAYLRTLLSKHTLAGAQRRFALDTLEEAAHSFCESGGRGYDVLASDPEARRGAADRGTGIWPEVQRLNRAFFEERRAAVRAVASHLEPGPPRDGHGDDDEPYHMRMFIADSLRPPGLEHLNGPGPHHELREDQATARREGFAGSRSTGARGTGRAAGGDFDGRDSDAFLYGEADAPWGAGDPLRSPEEAVAEYWGDNWAASETRLARDRTRDGAAYETHGDRYAWGDSWRENGGTRFMRREGIPFWQKGGREGYDRDIEETLGTAGRELDNHVRRWDMNRLREPRGQSYRRFGPRSGPVA